MRILWMYLRWPYDWVIAEIKFRRLEKRMRNQDPFIYEEDE